LEIVQKLFIYKLEPGLDPEPDPEPEPEPEQLVNTKLNIIT